MSGFSIRPSAVIFVTLLTSFLNPSFSQTGPAGVGTNDGTSTLIMWFRPDFGISTTGTLVDSWTNAAGWTDHNLTASGTQRPTLVNAAVNGYDELSFDGNDRLQITGNLSATNFINNQASSYVVTERSTTTANWVYATSPHQTDRFSCHISWSDGTVYYDIGGCCGTSTRIQVAGLPNLNTYSYWSYDALNSTGKQLYRNGVLLQNRANTESYTSYASHTFRIGETLNGNMTEVIIFQEKVNTAQRYIIENYLSAKYGLTASANDFYTMDDVANGNYDHEVAGIGRVDASNLHQDAQGSAILRINNPSDLDNDEFMIWGHDNGVQQATNFVDVPVSVQARLDRIWRTSEVNSSGTSVDVGGVDVSFDLTTLEPITASDLRLLIDFNNNGIFSDDIPISGATAIGGNRYEFAGVTGITNGLRFTLGTINVNLTPLPVELLFFNSKLQDDLTVLLDWETASESENRQFIVERSNDGTNWIGIDTLAGAINSSTLKYYSTIDNRPELGVNYYRLVQEDMNGEVKYSGLRSVNLIGTEIYEIYPNPTSTFLNVSLHNRTVNYSILDVTGRSVKAGNEITGDQYTIDISDLPKGVYLIKILDQSKTVSKKFVIE